MARDKQTTHRHISGDCLEEVPKLKANVDLVVADPPYSQPNLINSAVSVCRQKCSGASFFFMYAEDLLDLEHRPDQVLFWVKPPSTKNTSKRYSRFVEVLAAYDLNQSPFNQDTYWFSRSGIFYDVPLRTDRHPHTKPDSLIEKLVGVNSNRNDTVLDPFAGSSTVRRVCWRMHRNSISIEIDD